MVTFNEHARVPTTSMLREVSARRRFYGRSPQQGHRLGEGFAPCSTTRCAAAATSEFEESVLGFRSHNDPTRIGALLQSERTAKPAFRCGAFTIAGPVST